MTIEDLWALPRVGTPAVSSDGELLVVPVTTHDVRSNEALTRLWRIDGDGSATPLTGERRSASSPRISPDGRSILFLRVPGDAAPKGAKHADRSQVHVMPLDGGEARCLTDLPHGAVDPRWFPGGGSIALLSSVLLETPTLEATADAKQRASEEPTPPIVTEDRYCRHWDQWLEAERRLHLFRLDVETGDLRNLTPKLAGHVDPQDPSGQYDIAPDGSAVVLAATRRKKDRDRARRGIHLVELAGDGRPGRLRDVTNPTFGNGSQPRFAPDGSAILHGVHEDDARWDGRPWLAEVSRDGSDHRILTESWDLTAAEWSYRSDGKAILALAGVEGRGGLFTVSRTTGRVRELARGGTFTGLTVGGGRVFACASSLSRPPEVVSWTDTGREHAEHTRFAAEPLAELDLGRTEDLTFTGADDEQVQMHLVHPPGRRASAAGRRLPLVHLIHGGPHSTFADAWQARWCAQVFAARGHLVALVNFHGSDGWGQAFRSSIAGAWGDRPARDVMKATDWLIEHRRVDERRMAIAGGSYGGYLVSWLVGQTDRFACAVNHAGVCDLQAQYGSDLPDGFPRCAGGSPWSDRDIMDRWSPMRFADRFRTPMLILHGEHDHRVPYVQALEIYNTYKARGLAARLVFFRDENHWILKPANSVRWYEEVLDWLDRWL